MFVPEYKELLLMSANPHLRISSLPLYTPMKEVLPVIPNPTDFETVAMAEITVVGSSFATCDPPLYCASFEPR